MWASVWNDLTASSKSVSVFEDAVNQHHAPHLPVSLYIPKIMIVTKWTWQLSQRSRDKKHQPELATLDHTSTVKASNFRPHENFGLFLASSVASVDESCTRNEQNRTCRSKVFQQVLSSLFFCRTCFSDSKSFWKEVQSFHEVRS
jgi:hypothetical protein